MSYPFYVGQPVTITTYSGNKHRGTYGGLKGKQAFVLISKVPFLCELNQLSDRP